MASPEIFSFNTRKRKRSTLSTCREEKDSTPSNMLKPSSTSNKPRKRRIKLSTPESLLTINNPISNDKLISSNTTIQAQKSSPTSDQESISNDMAFKPFWNGFTKELSLMLSSCGKTDYADLDLNSWNGYAKSIKSASWFTTTISKKQTPSNPIHKNWLMTYFPSSMSLLPEEMVSDPPSTENKEQKTPLNRKQRKLQRLIKIPLLPEISEQKDSEMSSINTKTKKSKKKKKKRKRKGISFRTRKIQLFLTKEEKQVIRKWMGAARWTYNQCIDIAKRKALPINLKELRKALVSSNGSHNSDEKQKWLHDVPHDVKDEALRQFLTAYRIAKNNGTPIPKRFKSRKDNDEMLCVLSKNWSKRRWFCKTFAKPFNSAEPLPEVLHADSKLVRQRDRYYFCYPEPIFTNSKCNEPLPIKLDSETKFISVDPGVRTFLTMYDPDGYTLEFGKDDIGRIIRLCYYLDQLKSKQSKSQSHQQRHRIKKALGRMYRRIRNLVDDCHKKIIKFLLENYDVIIVPKCGTHQMCQRRGRKITTQTVRKMMSWSYGRFRSRLLEKQQQYLRYKNVRVVGDSEAYTSKTCGHCGHIHQRLGSNKHFKCPNCGFEADRDVHAARNIMLRYLTCADQVRTIRLVQQ